MNDTVTVKRYELGAGGKLVPVDESVGKGLPVGTVLHWGGNQGWAERDFCILSDVPSQFGAYYECFDMEEPDKNAMLHRVEHSNIKYKDDPSVWHRQHFFLTDKVCTPDLVLDFWGQHKAQGEAKGVAEAASKAENDRLTAEGRELWRKLGFEGAVAVIIAEHEHNESDLQSDYHGSKTTATVVLARSEHRKDVFSELRKAALRIPETAHMGPGKDQWRVRVVHAETCDEYYKGDYSRFHRDICEDDHGNILIFATETEAKAYTESKPLADAQTSDGKPLRYEWRIACESD